MSIGTGVFLPPEELLEEVYEDPFTINVDETIDLDLSGKATIRGERLRVKQKLYVEGDTELDNLIINGSLIINGVDVTEYLIFLASR